MRDYTIIKTLDGSQSIQIKDTDVTFHSRHGAVTESRHIFIKNGFEYAIRDNKNPVRILEVGFGTGLNAALTALEAAKQNTLVFYCAIEKFPLPETICSKLNYAAHIGGDGQAILDLLHTSPWNLEQKVNEYFTFFKKEQDLQDFKNGRVFDLIYFDAFAPADSPELWTEEVFKMLAGFLSEGGCLVTFCAKGEIKRLLKKCGFIVVALNGPPGKREMTRAVFSNH